MPLYEAQRTVDGITGLKQLSTKVLASRISWGTNGFDAVVVYVRLHVMAIGQSMISSTAPSHTKYQEALPLWAQRLGRSSLLSGSPHWPHTPEEGLRQSLALSDFGHRQLIERGRTDHPGISPDALFDLTYQQICAWQKLRSSLRFRLSS